MSIQNTEFAALTFAEKIIAFNQSLVFSAPLPSGVAVMNPFRENPGTLAASSAFYRKFYNDNTPRSMLIGINPGRFGAGLTGVPFTDPKRLRDECGIHDYPGPDAHEPSSVFVYEVIRKFGSQLGGRLAGRSEGGSVVSDGIKGEPGAVDAFYSRFYINSICPLGFVQANAKGREVNHNYYDSPALFAGARSFMVESMRAQLCFGIRRELAFVLGTGKNFKCISELNREYGFFDELIPLEHPRYIIQYKSRQMQSYVEKYLDVLSRA